MVTCYFIIMQIFTLSSDLLTYNDRWDPQKVTSRSNLRLTNILICVKIHKFIWFKIFSYGIYGYSHTQVIIEILVRINSVIGRRLQLHCLSVVYTGCRRWGRVPEGLGGTFLHWRKKNIAFFQTRKISKNV